MLRLTLESEGEVMYLPFPHEKVVLGSSRVADLTCPFVGISRRHAALSPFDGRLLLEDLDSKNGLWRSGQRVPQAVMTVGDFVELGGARLRLEEISTADGRGGLEIEPRVAGPAVTKATEDAAPAVGAATPHAALRCVRRLEALPDAALLDEAGVLDDARGSLGANVLFTYRVRTRGGLLLFGVSGGMPPEVPAETVLARTGEDAFELCVDGRCLLLAVGSTTGLGVGAVFESRADGWRRDFVEYLRDRIDRTPRVPATEVPVASVPLIYPSGMIAGSSPEITAVYEQATRIAGERNDVLLLGETGAGKELFAKMLHASGSMASGPFVDLNCAAIPSTLLEAHLFGIEAGVATGVSERPGLFRLADGGTLLLDEIGEMPLELQAKLLRVLQEREVWSVGASCARPIDVRVISASNVDLHSEAGEGRFREDLFYRLCQLELRVPPLRERRGDLPEIILELVRRSARRNGKRLDGVSRRAVELLVAQPWPGNFRQLEHVLDQAVSMCPAGGRLERRVVEEALAPYSEHPSSSSAATEVWPESLQQSTDRFQLRLIRETLARTSNNKTAAARHLGITRQGLNRMLRRFERDAADQEPDSR